MSAPTTPGARTLSTLAIACAVRDVAGWLEKGGWIPKHIRTLRAAAERLQALEAENERVRKALGPFAAVCDAEHMGHVRDEQVLELCTRLDVIVSEKLRGRDFRAARAALPPIKDEEKANG